MVRTQRADAPGQAPAAKAVAGLLFGDYRHRVLSLLFQAPPHALHVRMISRLTGVPAGSLHRELKQLAEAGLLLVERRGNQVLYRANPRSLVYEEIAGILGKTAGTPPTLHERAASYEVAPSARLPDIDKQALAAICRKYGVKKMSLFGSAARNALRPESDVDLLVEFNRSSRTSTFDLVHLQEELSPLFGGRVIQIAGPGILRNPYRRQTIAPDLKLLYAA